MRPVDDVPMADSRLKVVLSFDIEVWCNGWKHLDEAFPGCFERYVYGRSEHGEYALPATLDILRRHGLHAVFFVEPMFAARFGVQHLRAICDMIQAAGQEIQLHLHPEWTNEIEPLLFAGAVKKRQHLSYYTLEEQVTLIETSIGLLGEAGVARPTAFRAGSFAANRDTFRALSRCGIELDSSLSLGHPASGLDMRTEYRLDRPIRLDGVDCFPLTVFRDGLGRVRPLQVAACGAGEMISVLERAHAAHHDHVMALSHNFEMLRPASSLPDWIMVRRFERLCAYLQREEARFATVGLDALRIAESAATSLDVSVLQTGKRLLAQGLRQLRG